MRKTAKAALCLCANKGTADQNQRQGQSQNQFFVHVYLLKILATHSPQCYNNLKTQHNNWVLKT